jgi:hypothetical protein
MFEVFVDGHVSWLLVDEDAWMSWALSASAPSRFWAVAQEQRSKA